MADVNISSLSLKQVPELAHFSKLIHPKLNNAKERILWFTFSTPFLKDNETPPALLALSREGKVVGQFMLNGQEWNYQGETNSGFFGYDFFIEKSFRGSGIGALLLFKVIRQYKPFFGIGLTEAAERLYNVAKVKEIGSFKKFLWINNPLSSCKHVLSYLVKLNSKYLKLSHTRLFPQKINVGGLIFELVERLPEEKYKPYYDPGVIEFSRSTEFLRWRFFDSDIKYYFYYCENYNTPLFFVVRPILKKGLNLLSLVDYKVSVEDATAWRAILRAAKKITKDTDLDGLVSVSSYDYFSSVFKKEGFFTVGKPAPIVSTVYDTLPAGNISKETTIFITMADSDVDLNFGDN